MFTIKRAAALTGVPETSLRTWERRYGAWSPHRDDAGYRRYDEEALAAISTMRRLMDDGWSPAAAAEAVRCGTAPPPTPGATRVPSTQIHADPTGAARTARFLAAAKRLDVSGMDQSLDDGFALGSFERVVDTWLFPTLALLGEAWARGEVDIAGEHAASHSVHRRLATAFDAAGSTSRGPAVVVGVSPGGRHELGALAFATAIRRRGLNVLYLGANVPLSAWDAAVTTHRARAVVLAVVRQNDRRAATAVVEHLAQHPLAPLVCSGGSAGTALAPGVHTLPPAIGAAAERLDTMISDQ